MGILKEKNNPFLYHPLTNTASAVTSTITVAILPSLSTHAVPLIAQSHGTTRQSCCPPSSFSLLQLQYLLIIYHAKPIPLGGSVFRLDSPPLSERHSKDIGTDCGGDPDCITTYFGCGCGFVDGSWMDDPSITGGPTINNGINGTSVFNSSAVLVTLTLGSSSTGQPAPVTTTSTPS